MKTNTTISIVKAIAIILMVVGHAECPGWLGRFIYEFYMPVFFITAGYFFSTRYLDDEATFLKKRIKGLYFPFVKWAVFFLLINNLMFYIGIKNETYGNIGGGVTHPQSWHQMQQNLWTIVTAMGGYDQFLAGAFWFFRALLVVSVLYLALFKIYTACMGRASGRKPHRLAIPAMICLTALLLGLWKTAEGLKVVNIIQGGNREIMGLFFFGAGYIFRQTEHHFKPTAANTVILGMAVAVCSHYIPSSMAWNASLQQFVTLPLPALCGFLMTYSIAVWINRKESAAKRFLVFCGNNTLPIFVFHIISFKVVSLIKIWWYGLDIRQIGCHMVIHEHAQADLFWIAYTIAGVGIPLAAQYAVTRMRASRLQ